MKEMKRKVGRPISKHKKTVISGLIPENTLKEVVKIAKKKKTSISKVVAEIIENSVMGGHNEHIEVSKEG